MRISEDRVRQLLAIPAVHDKFTRLQISRAEDLLGFFYLDQDGVRRLASGVDGYNTDTRPIVEFDSPKYLMGPNSPDVFLEILENSYASTLPYGDEAKAKTVNRERILSREKFYGEWRIPQEVTQVMLQRSLNR